MTKACTKCGEAKPLSAFIRNSNKPDGTDNECRRCRAIRELSPDTLEARRDRDLRRKYKISLSAYNLMFEQQGGVCAICKKPETKTNRFGEVLPLACDHNHDTGRLRGLLCSQHNAAIGALGDTPQQVHLAFSYVFERDCP